MGSHRLPADHVDPSPLSEPLHFEFANKTAPNRFLKAAMTERLSTWDPDDFSKRGIPTQNLINLYQKWGEGGMGVILTGNIMLDYDQLEAAGNMIIPLDAPFSGERFEAYKALATAAKAHGMLIVGQVSHPGRQSEQRIQPNPISASDIQLEGNIMGMQFAKPHAATQAEIDRVVQAFTHAAEYLHRAGFDGIQLHAAHGYLLAQFLSQTTNQRLDHYGGSLANRARLILDIARSIHTQLPPTTTNFILAIKLNSVEFQPSGFTPDEAHALCLLLERDAHFDFVELSGGTYQALAFKHPDQPQRESTKKREAFFLDFAAAIAPALHKTKTYVTGGLRSLPAMVEALAVVDGVGLGRPFCQEPLLGRQLLEGTAHEARNQLLDQQDFGLTNVAAGSQMRQLAKGQDPIDLSRQENVELFMSEMQAWAAGMKEDRETMRLVGFVDIAAQVGGQYGAAAGAA
jgi:2,4-dienoyl-CoA reductase-like NADH-dependent reductase (Old Yellow Enzyme family)